MLDLDLNPADFGSAVLAGLPVEAVVVCAGLSDNLRRGLPVVDNLRRLFR